MSVIVAAGPVDGLFEEIEVSSSRAGGKFPGVRCKACGQLFLCGDPAKMPSHVCAGLVAATDDLRGMPKYTIKDEDESASSKP